MNNSKVFLNEKVAKKIFKNPNYGKKLSALIISYFLKADYQEVFNNLILSSEEIAFSALTMNSTSDVIYYDDSCYFNIELNFYQSESKEKQLQAYCYQLFLGQLHSFHDYTKIKKIIQISLDTYDLMDYNEFIYHGYMMDEKHKVIMTRDIQFIHVNLAYLRNLDYNKIISDKDKLEHILYFFVCNDDKKIKDVYKGDNLMAEIIHEAKKIAGLEKMDLYLTDEEMLKLDQEHFRRLGIEEGKELGIQEGKELGAMESKKNIITNMLNQGFSIDTIATCVGLSVDEITKIVENL